MNANPNSDSPSDDPFHPMEGTSNARCVHRNDPESVRHAGLDSALRAEEQAMTVNDKGPDPSIFDLETETTTNQNYRTVAWSGKYPQVTLMSIPVGESVGLEAHPDTDQFLRLDAGKGRVVMGPAEDNLTIEHEVGDGWRSWCPPAPGTTSSTSATNRCGCTRSTPRSTTRRQGTADRCRRRARRRGGHRRTTELVRAARVGRPRPARRLILNALRRRHRSCERHRPRRHRAPAAGRLVGDCFRRGHAVARAIATRPEPAHRPLDVTDHAQWLDALADLDHLDLLVNNAGLLSSGAFEQIDAERHRAIVEVNVLGVVNGALAAFPLLARTPNAAMVNLASASATYGQPDLATYSATKFAVRGLTEALDLEWAQHDIRCSTCGRCSSKPGWSRTCRRPPVNAWGST